MYTRRVDARIGGIGQAKVEYLFALSSIPPLSFRMEGKIWSPTALTAWSLYGVQHTTSSSEAIVQTKMIWVVK